MRKISFILSLILIFMIPWEGVIQLDAIGNAAKLFGFGVAAFWLATIVVTRRVRRPAAFHVVTSFFVLWNFISVLWSSDSSRTATQVLTWFQLLTFVYILWDLYTTRAALFAGLQAYVLGAYVAVGSAIVNYFAGNAFYTHYQRFSPGDLNPDGFGFILALGIPVAWYLAVSINAIKLSKLLKLVNFIYIPAAFLGIALSGTRTAMIASIPGMVFGLSSLTHLRFSARASIMAFLISAILILLPHIETLTSFQRFGTIGTEMAEGDLNQRTLLWSEGLSAFTDHPFLGIGSNMYRSVNSLNKVAHNSFISVLVELGLIGFVLFATILGIAIIEAWSQPKWDSRFWLTSLLVWAIGASTLTWEYRKSTWLFLTLLMVSAALTRFPAKTEKSAWSDAPDAQGKQDTVLTKLPSGEEEGRHLTQN